MTSIDQLDQFLSENPDIEIFEVLLHDLNGAQRGKWLPRDKIHKLFKGGFKMPLSSCSLDYWGRDQDELIAATGDSDGVCCLILKHLLGCLGRTNIQAKSLFQ
jgi:glutamine synthetase